MKKFLIAFSLLFIFGCEYPQPEPISGLNEQTQAIYNIKFLFEVNGVKIYRFYDKGNSRYFATKGGSVLNQMQSQRVGKTTTYHDSGVIDADFAFEIEELADELIDKFKRRGVLK